MSDTKDGQTPVNDARTQAGFGAGLTHEVSAPFLELPTARGLIILIDRTDAEEVHRFSWHAIPVKNGRFYAGARIKGTSKRITLHRLLMRPPPGTVVHHKNNNGLDNRRANLEVTTQRQNALYAFDGREVGVHFHKQTGKWRAQLRGPDGKFVSLGMHSTREAAVFAATTFRETRV